MTKTNELADIITVEPAEIIIKAFRCKVRGFDNETIIYAKTASKARYLFKLNCDDRDDDISFQHIGVRRAPELDMKFPILPAVAAKLNEEDKELIIHAFGGGSHIKPERWGYRDHYCCQPNDEMLTKLVSRGLFRGPCGVDAKGVMPGWTGAFFYLTDSGKEVALALIGLREYAK